ncbi:MAG: hypothetical protein LAO56_13565 [Acidobacteriia bacterium]|nr:hypothetical protein [Terriglobia bacterium]
MKHFSEQVWTDFVRGIGASQTDREIEAHIASGCPDCAATRSLWKRVYSITGNEPSFTPPDDVVRMVKLESAASQSPKPSPWTMARLVFDSLSQPLTAGVRSGASDSRQLVFEAEGTMLDLVLDSRPQSGTLSLIGQVVDKGGAKVAPRQVAVILWTETGQPLAETSANEFGEFQLEFAAQDRLRLSVEIPGHKPVRIPPINLDPDVMRPPVT